MRPTAERAIVQAKLRSLTQIHPGWLAALLFVVAHGATLAAAGANAKLASYCFLIAAPLASTCACLWRIQAEKSGQGWLELALATGLWAAGMAANMLVDLSFTTAGDVPGLSMVLYVLYGAPLIFAAASPARDRWPARTVDAILALSLGALFCVYILSFSSLTHTPSDRGVAAIRWLFDVENAFIALFAVMRWGACDEPRRKAFFATLAVFGCLYLMVSAFINHLMSYVDFGGPADLVIGVPFLWLAGEAVFGSAVRPVTASPSATFSVAVRAGSPLMLPATLLVVACALLSVSSEVAVIGFVVATLGYGLRNVLSQMRGIAEHDRLNMLARLDALTGLPNRRQFDATLVREWSRSRRHGRAIAVAVIDIDHFKQLNDGLGHLVGDERLRSVAQTLAGCLTRSDDFLARFGGEEFVAILSDMSRADVAMLIESMRKAIATQALSTPAPQGVITISIGWIWIPAASGEDPKTAVAAADAALYRAKAEGRNRSVEAAPGALSA